MSQLILVTTSFREFLQKVDYEEMAREHGARYVRGYQVGMQDVAALLEMVGQAAYAHLLGDPRLEEEDENPIWPEEH